MENKLKFLLILLLSGVFCVWSISNIISYESAEFWSNTTTLAISSILLVACIVNNFKIGIKGMHGKAWVLFTLAIATWYIAELLWVEQESSDFVDSELYANIFWFVGYGLYFLFGIMYLKPFSHQISKKNILATSFMILPILFTVIYTIEPQFYTSENILNASYPIADSIMLIPSILGTMLFFKGRVKFAWSTIFFGMIVFVIADYGFMYFNYIEEYYAGHVTDLLYIWAYAILIIGVIANLNILKRTNKNTPFNDQSTMR
ncbi:MAG: hypothetical protein ACE5R5_06175 [Nitrosarchaeum sp.]